MVIISASGMAETGRILHHLKNNIEDPKNTVLIVSWQAPNTLGRRIADREPAREDFRRGVPGAGRSGYHRRAFRPCRAEYAAEYAQAAQRQTETDLPGAWRAEAR